MTIGDKVTVVILGGLSRCILVAGPLNDTWNVRLQSKRAYRRTRTADLSPDREGVTWARGWDGPAVAALRAARALR